MAFSDQVQFCLEFINGVGTVMDVLATQKSQVNMGKSEFGNNLVMPFVHSSSAAG